VRECTALQPSREAIEWGKRQAAQSPPWSAEKWRSVGIIFGTELEAVESAPQNDEAKREAA